jgi:hypothetical protein
MVFMLRKPKLPCIAFAGDQAYAVLKYADLDRVTRSVKGGSFQVYDREGMEFEYLSKHAFLAPAFTVRPVTKKDLVAKVFDSKGMAAADTRLRDRNLDGIRLDDLVGKLAAAVKAQAARGRVTPADVEAAEQPITTLAG